MLFFVLLRRRPRPSPLDQVCRHRISPSSDLKLTINSAATLKRAMKTLIEDLDDVDFYFGDILIHTRTWEEHIRALRELFSRLVQAGLTIRPTKCLFGANSVDFLGHRLEQVMIGLHRDNVEKIKDATRHSTKKQVRSFMGLGGY